KSQMRYDYCAKEVRRVRLHLNVKLPNDYRPCIIDQGYPKNRHSNLIDLLNVFTFAPMESTVGLSFIRLKAYCEKEEYRGWDPYDGLTSRVFQFVPIVKSSRFCQLAWIQLFKRNPVNLRRLAGIDKNYNAKGLALFLSGYCNLHQFEPHNNHLE